jgi:hypothetical protein
MLRALLHKGFGAKPMHPCYPNCYFINRVFANFYTEYMSYARNESGHLVNYGRRFHSGLVRIALRITLGQDGYGKNCAGAVLSVCVTHIEQVQIALIRA